MKRQIYITLSCGLVRRRFWVEVFILHLRLFHSRADKYHHTDKETTSHFGRDLEHDVLVLCAMCASISRYLQQSCLRDPPMTRTPHPHHARTHTHRKEPKYVPSHVVPAPPNGSVPPNGPAPPGACESEGNRATPEGPSSAGLY